MTSNDAEYDRDKLDSPTDETTAELNLTVKLKGSEETSLALAIPDFGVNVPCVDTENVVHTVVDKTDDEKNLGTFNLKVQNTQNMINDFFEQYRKRIFNLIYIVMLLLYIVYFIYCLSTSRRSGDAGSIQLLIFTLIAMFILTWCYCEDWFTRSFLELTSDISSDTKNKIQIYSKWLLYLLTVTTMLTLLIILVVLRTPGNLVSLAGLAAFIFITWVTSVNPARVNWHTVFWGFSLQFYLAVVILKTRWGFEIFRWLGDRVSKLIQYTDEGSRFVFGDNFKVHFMAFSVLPIIIFFSSITSLLYYLGVMQAVIGKLGRFLSFCLHTTPAESISAAGNIFIGMVEAPLMVRPFIFTMTKAELHSVMTGGMATIAGTVMGVYIGFGVPANHLMSASVMSAPAALAISKLTYPETETPINIDDIYHKMEARPERNMIEAASSGAVNAISLVASVTVNLIAFLSILQLVNDILGWFGQRAGIENLTFQYICSYMLYPVAMFMGTELRDCRLMAELVGIKTFTNEFLAYRQLDTLLENRQTWLNYSSKYDISNASNVIYKDLDIELVQWNAVLKNGFLTPRSEVIATYALCGFSNFGSIGILLGGLGAMAPERKHDMAALAMRSFVMGNVACFFTACVAGLLYDDSD